MPPDGGRTLQQAAEDLGYFQPTEVIGEFVAAG
jgi:hypothetical protein